MKLEVGGYYFYAQCKRRMLCTGVGKDLSFFKDYLSREYQFYNHDMYLNKYIRQNK